MQGAISLAERRINVRVDQDLYQRLDNKRHSAGGKWQQICMDLLMNWLEGGDSAPPSKTEEDPVLRQVREILAGGDEKAKKGLRELTGLAYDHFLAWKKRS